MCADARSDSCIIIQDELQDFGKYLEGLIEVPLPQVPIF